MSTKKQSLEYDVAKMSIKQTSTPPARGDARVGPGPAGVEGEAGLVEIDDERGVIGRDGFALARLAIDLRPHDAFLHRLGHEQVIDAHPEILVEHPGSIVPPREAIALGMMQ